MNKLFTLFDRLDSKPFEKLRILQDKFRIGGFNLAFLRIQKSPGAHPASIGELSCSHDRAGFPEDCIRTPEGRVAVSDFLIRRFSHGIERFAKQNRGKDGSGSFHTIELSQKILKRDSVILSKKNVTLRFIVSFPSKSRGGGHFDGHQAKLMFQQELLAIARYGLIYAEFDRESREALFEHVRVLTDRKAIHSFLSRNNCVVFIPDHAILPRKSGIDDRPLESESVRPFHSPVSLAVEISLAGNRKICGMALKEGVAVITGGGFHGKSTLLQAIASGIYPHVPGDGREYIVTRGDAVTVRSEEGRHIEKVNISPFVRTLPAGSDPVSFSTENASGTTSQAAGIIEALEAGSRLLLFDEDSSATNFLVRDHLIHKIIPEDQEPIRPLYHVVRSMWEKQGISSLLVVGGLGIFLQKADTILVMKTFACTDATSLVRKHLGPLDAEENGLFQIPEPRVLKKDNFDPSYTNQRLKKELSCRIKPLRRDTRKLEYGMDLIDLSALPQLVEAPQTMAVGLLIFELKTYLDSESQTRLNLKELLDRLYSRIDRNSFLSLDHDYPGTISLPRRAELAAAISRMRSLRVAVGIDIKTGNG